MNDGTDINNTAERLVSLKRRELTRIRNGGESYQDQVFTAQRFAVHEFNAMLPGEAGPVFYPQVPCEI